MQLALNLKLRDSATFDNYLGHVNSARVDMLRNALDQTVSQSDLEYAGLFYFIHGTQWVGKTHLLQAACHELEKQHCSVFYLSLDNPSLLSPEILEDCASFDLLCIDDIHRVLGDIRWETALFNTFNDAKQAGNMLVVSGDASPVNLRFSLPDLASRLSSGVTLSLEEPVDEVKSDIIRARARLRGLEMSEEVMTYIMKRSGRGMSDLVDLLQKLDDKSLKAKRRLTVPFVKDAFGW